MKLLSAPLSMFGAKAEIAALEKDIPVDTEFVPFSLSTFYQPRHPDVARINPKLQVPVLIDGDLEIFDSTQIFEYFEDLKPSPALWPTDLKQRAAARLLELKSDEVFFPNVVNLFPNNQTPDHADRTNTSKKEIDAFYDAMDQQLAGQDYLAGDYSYADVAFYMAQFFASFIGRPMAADHTRLVAWRSRVGERPAVKQVVGAMRTYLADNGIPTDGF